MSGGNLRFGTVAAAAAVLMGAAAAMAAGPTPEAMAPLKEQLEKKIRVQYLDAPLAKALDQLQRDAGVTFVIDRARVGRLGDTPVSLQAESMSIKTTLDWVTTGAGLDWDVRDGVVFISTRREILRPHVVLEVYDVRALTVRPPDFTGAPEFDLNSALSNTSSGGSSGGAQAATTLFSDDEGDVDTQGLTAQELEEAVRDSVNPEDWSTAGGDLGVSVRATSNGLLMVKHTAEVQARVRELLEKYQKAAGKMVSIDARFLVVRTDALDALLADNKGALVLDAAKAATFMKDAGPLNAGVRVLGAARTICMNSQRVHVSASNERAFLSDLEPVSGGVGVDPTTSVMSNGSLVDVQPDITFDNAGIVMTLRSRLAEGHVDMTTAIPSGGLTAAGVTDVARAPAAAAAADDAKPQPPTIARLLENPVLIAKADLGLPEQDLVAFNTTVRIPDGGAIVLTGMSSAFRHLKVENAEVVLFLRATVITGGAAPGAGAPGGAGPEVRPNTAPAQAIPKGPKGSK